MPLRIPNPESDISRLVTVYRLINKRPSADEPLSLDEISSILAHAGQASSSGAIGQEALSRSFNPDRSRDPLYNQSKMYSELFRMLGWLRPANTRHEYRSTILGDEIAHSSFLDGPTASLIGESFLGIVFPNPATANVGVINHRPFAWLLRLISAVGGHITRHEMILGLLAITDDRHRLAFESAVDRILSVRPSLDKLYSAVDAVARENNITRTTLENYTRVPIGLMKSPVLDWGSTTFMKGLYAKSVKVISLTTNGYSKVAWLDSCLDIRDDDLLGYRPIDRAYFAIATYFSMLERATLLTDVDRYLRDDAWENAYRIRDDYDLRNPLYVLYSPYQQTPDDILDLATDLANR